MVAPNFLTKTYKHILLRCGVKLAKYLPCLVKIWRQSFLLAGVRIIDYVKCVRGQSK